MATYDYVVSTGVIVPNTEGTLIEVQNEYKLAFNDTELVVDTGPLSVLIEAEAESRDQLAKNNAQVANQINPNIAGGVFLDAIFALFGSERAPGTRTTVTAVLTGNPGVIIPEGSAAQSTAGDIFISTGDATLDGTGQATQIFEAQEVGAINLASASLNQIVDDIIGWDTITNPLSGTPGSDTESDISAQNTRNYLLGLQSNSMPESTIANVSAVDDVQSLTFRENTANTTEIIDGISMLPHSIFVCVNGGIDSDVAQAILNSKSGGCDFNGTTTVIVTDQYSNQDYSVSFQRPATINIFIEVFINPSSTLTDPTTLTKEAVLAYVNGEIEGYLGFVVGADVNPFDIDNGVNAYNSSINATRVEVGLTAGVLSADNIAIAVDEIAITIESNITVTEV